MRRFFILSGNYSEENVGAVHSDRTEFGGFDPAVLRNGRRIGCLPTGVSLHLSEPIDRAIRASVVVEVNGMGAISGRLADVLERVAPSQIEFLEIRVFDCDGIRVPEPFFVLNPLNILDVLSEKATVRTSRPLGSIWPVVHLGICGSAVPGNTHIFRVKGWEFPILIDDVAKEALTSVPHEGLDFGKVAQEGDIYVIHGVNPWNGVVSPSQGSAIARECDPSSGLL